MFSMYEAAVACREFASDFCKACKKLGQGGPFCAASCLYAALVEEWEKASSIDEKMWVDLDVGRLAALAGYGEGDVAKALRWLAGCRREYRLAVLEVLCAGMIDYIAQTESRCKKYPPTTRQST